MKVKIYGSRDDKEIFDNYLLTVHYPRFQIIANSIKNYFNPKKILDVGCAKGFLVKAFSENGTEARGIDVSEYAIANAPEDIKSMLYKVDLNYNTLPFKDEEFDFITFIWTMQYITNWEHAIKEVKRVLKKNGYVYLSKVPKRKIKEEIKSMNIYKSKHWIKEFESNGFIPLKKRLIFFEINSTMYQMFEIQNKNSIQFKMGRKIYQKGGYIGKLIIFFIYKLINLHPDRVYSEFLFIKK